MIMPYSLDFENLCYVLFTVVVILSIILFLNMIHHAKVIAKEESNCEKLQLEYNTLYESHIKILFQADKVTKETEGLIKLMQDIKDNKIEEG